MVDEVNILFEGDSKLRPGFHALLARHVERARSQRIRVKFISGGSGPETVKDFLRICRSSRSSQNILLIDSEGPVPNTVHAIRTLRASSFWDQDVVCDDDQINFMVQAMEVWFIADPQSLVKHFGQDFNINALPHPQNAESTAPSETVTAIRRGLRRGRRSYDKVSDGARLLEFIDETTVSGRCRHFRRFMSLIDRVV